MGVEDFNYPELKQLEANLDTLKIPNHIATFDGDHRWASSKLLTEAVEWMELQAMRLGRQKRDQAFVDALWNQRLENAREAETNSNQYAEYLNYKMLAGDFAGLKIVEEYEKRAATLSQSRAVRQAIRREQEQLREQQEIAERVINMGGRLLAEPTSRAIALKELKTTVEGLLKKSRAANENNDRLVVRRALFQVSAQTFEAALYNYLPGRQYNLAIVNLLVAEEVTTDLARIPFELARAYALNGEKKPALAALRRAIEKGLTDVTIIENQKDLDSLRAELEYKSILTRATKEKVPVHQP